MTTDHRTLRRDALSARHGVALAAAAMAPALSAALNVSAAKPAGAAVPLAFLLAFAACLLVGNTVVQFARRLPSAGSFYTFNGHGLGPAAGFFSGWLFALGYALFPVAAFPVLGFAVQDFLGRAFAVVVPWWPVSLAGWIAVLLLSLLGIKLSVRVDLTLLVVGMGIFLSVAAAALFGAGSGHDWEYFRPPDTGKGLAGLGIGVVFGILSFIGFDAAATLGEETSDPRRNVPRAVAGALGLVGTFFVLVMYALAAGYGLNRTAELDRFLNDKSPFGTLAQMHAPRLASLLALCIAVSVFSCFLATHNATVRLLFAMGRDRVLPAGLGRAHRRWASPHRAIYVQSLFTLAAGLGLGFAYGPEPEGAYSLAGAIGTVAVILVWVLGNLALIRHSAGRPDFHRCFHGVLPVLGVLMLLYPLWAQVAADDEPGQTYPARLVPFAVLAWLALGVGAYVYLRRTAPEKLAAVGSLPAEMGQSKP